MRRLETDYGTIENNKYSGARLSPQQIWFFLWRPPHATGVVYTALFSFLLLSFFLSIFLSFFSSLSLSFSLYLSLFLFFFLSFSSFILSPFSQSAGPLKARGPGLEPIWAHMMNHLCRDHVTPQWAVPISRAGMEILKSPEYELIRSRGLRHGGGDATLFGGCSSHDLDYSVSDGPKMFVGCRKFLS